MKKILVVKQLNILNIFIVIIYKFFKFEVYIYKFSKRIESWHLLKFLSLQECNFEECIDIDFNYYGGKSGDAIDKVVNDLTNNDLLENFIPFLANIKDSRKKHKLLVKDYILGRCSDLSDIYTWANGYFTDQKENGLNVYLLGDVCKIGAHFLEIRSSNIKIVPVFSSNIFIVSSVIFKVLNTLFRKFFVIISRVVTTKSNNIGQPFFISNNSDTLLYKILYFPHKSIFYGDLFVKDIFYSTRVDSEFYPSNILHVELEDVDISEKQYKYYRDNNITSVILPKSEIKTIYNSLIYILGEIGLKKVLFFIRKDFVLFFVFVLNSVRLLSIKDLIRKNYSAKLVLVGYDIRFPWYLSH